MRQPFLPRRRSLPVFFFFMLLALMIGFSDSAFGQLSTIYRFTAGTGTAYDFSSGATTISMSGQDDGVSAVLDIGFTFMFNTVTYTKLSMNTNGRLKLGEGAISTAYDNEGFPASVPTTDYPFIAPVFDDLYLRPNGVRMKIFGTAPNRVTVVHWNVERYQGNSTEDVNMQVRLYETTNKIEIWYGGITLLSSTPDPFNSFIGIASSGSNYIGVIPGPPAGIYTSGNTLVVPPAANTMYTFDCYNVRIDGHPSEGGTLSMNNGEQILTNALQDVGVAQVYRPFTTASNGCGTANFTYTITGPHAADYQITPTSVQVPGGQSITPELTFRPSTGGLREATLTVTDGVMLTRSYPLRGRGSSIKFIGNIPQGGVAVMSDGAELMKIIKVRPGLSGNFTPLTVQNINTNLGSPAVNVSYAIAGLSGGQYSVAPSSTAVNPSSTATPVVTFTPTGIGTILDELVVTTSEGIVRRYKLMAIADIPAVVFQVSGNMVDSTSTLFTNVQGCVGAEVVSIPLDAVNVGIGTVTITNVRAFLTDTVYRNGTPRYPTLLDAQGQPITMNDYFITDRPVDASFNNNSPLPATIQVDQGQTKQLYLNFISAQPNKRFGRLYIYTDGASYGNIDVDGTYRRGLLRVDVFARGSGSRFAGSATGERLKTITFPATPIGGTEDLTIPLFNTGTCTLKVSLTRLMVTSGDVDEFQLIRMPSSEIDLNGNLVLPPGFRDEMVIRFTPKQGGSRRASLRMATNDSTIHTPGITERGVYYLDMYGEGLVDLYADGIEFGAALIDGDASEHLHDVVRLRNTTNSTITLTSIVLDNAADFSEDPARPWPSVPYVIEAGEELELGVRFHPTGGEPGERTAKMEFLTNSPIASVELKGIAGTRTMEVRPQHIDFPNTTPGKFQRRMVRITNTGTMPIKITQPELGGPDKTLFHVTQIPFGRTTIEPGSSEVVELTYQPVGVPGFFSAWLEIAGNPTNAPLTVTLTASSMPKGRDNDPSAPVAGDIENGVGNGLGRSNENLSMSGVDAESAAAGMLLRQSMPNPARDVVEISYVLAKAGEVELALYDGSGRLVQVMDSGMRAAGERSIRLDVSRLAAGMYHYRLTANGQSLSRMMHVTK